MAIYELTNDSIQAVNPTTFGMEGFKERADLQRILRSHVDVVSPGTLVIAEEFTQWEDSKRRIDLLGLDRDAKLVVIELKRTEDGGHMDLQAIRYAAMISPMTFEQVVTAREAFQRANGIEEDAQAAILNFLEWDEPDEDEFAQDVRIVLVSGDFSKELTSAVIWLTTKHDLDIRCVRLKPYSFKGQVLLDVQQVIPLPEAAEYQVQVKEKTQKEKQAKKSNADFTRYDLWIGDQKYPEQRKRWAILHIVKAVVQQGNAPEQVSKHLPFRRNRLFWRVDGEVGCEQFVLAAQQWALANNRAFDPRRWFTDDEDLIHWEGATYALSNQWGSRWSEAVDILAAAYPHLQIRYRAVGKDDAVSKE